MRVWIALRTVPACDPRTPKLASAPTIFAVSSIVSPVSAASGATYLNASPRSSSVCAEPLAVAVRTSTTRVISDASSRNARNAFDAISVAGPISVPVARARSMTPAIDASISSDLKPARPSEIMPCAASAAVHDVVRPSSFACSVSFSNCAPVAPVTACTSRIWSSNSANVFVASATGVAIANALIIADLAPDDQALSRCCACVKSRLSLSIDAPSSTYARPALIPCAVAMYYPSFIFASCALTKSSNDLRGVRSIMKGLKSFALFGCPDAICVL